jgi:hypothetical protein
MSERPWTDQMRALVWLLGLMRREGNVSGKAVKRAIDAVRDGLVSAYEGSCWREDWSGERGRQNSKPSIDETERMAQVAGR